MKIKVIHLSKILLFLTLLVTLLTVGISIVIATSEDYIDVPIIMYHSILKDPSRSNKYTVTPAVLEEDLKYIKDKGYTTVTIADLISYVYDDSPLPEKPIVLTFDDGHYNNYGYLFPLLEKYDMKAVISIVGSYTDKFSETDEANLNYSYLRWKDIKELMNTGRIEFQNHTYNLHSNTGKRIGTKKIKGETDEHYKSILKDDILKLQQEFEGNTNYTPKCFTYPFGGISNASLDIIKELGFKASLSCEQGINKLTKNPNSLYLLKRYNRPSYISTYNFFQKIN
ncbi:MAG: polysaccharide deacetylase family protein [Clostridium sp.]|nr:polysaccharide deacetylase family protein [Clostridium sp.]